MNDEETAAKLTPSSIFFSRGHQHKLLKKRVRYDTGKYYFTERTVIIWNSLPYIHCSKLINNQPI